MIQGGASGWLRQEFRELEMLDEITRLQIGGILHPTVKGELRTALIISYHKWRGLKALPAHIHKALKINNGWEDYYRNNLDDQSITDTIEEVGEMPQNNKKQKAEYENEQVISLYCGNACAKRAGAPLPNLGGLVKRAKDLDLPQLLAQEAQLEKVKHNPVEPQSINSLVKGGVWRLESKEGTTDVLLTWKYNNEEIRVNFNTAELDPFEPDEDSDDEDNNQGGFAPQEDDNEFNNETAPQPIECRISNAKPCGGALLINGYVWSNKLSILKISYIKDARLVSEDTAEADNKILASGVGPEFESLPKRIQEEFGKYLDDCGIDSTLVQAINGFIKSKMQKEALGWFEAVQAFVAT
ncbi:hypothetical protein M422DRAFT_259507 [Sphaerobolus stellatus SS14]|uniref:Uncharacterized protein n=1 Tax=Sphaerobolus stellatus (strain SS14) TaxID=990650 RepID=A0A0C9USU5_SPHS4|nr:hypothetical protein M422DRAFT_259507 [Sphaerobolus stellatus SS14]